jgi:hypothetical protein
MILPRKDSAGPLPVSGLAGRLLDSVYSHFHGH